MKGLPTWKAMLLARILVRENAKTVGISVSYGTIGMGGSNTSGALQDRVEDYSLEQLRKSAPLRLWDELELCAVIGDRFYLRNRKKKTLKSYAEEGKFILGDAVAYDTHAYQEVNLIFTEEG